MNEWFDNSTHLWPNFQLGNGGPSCYIFIVYILTWDIEVTYKFRDHVEITLLYIKDEMTGFKNSSVIEAANCNAVWYACK